MVSPWGHRSTLIQIRGEVTGHGPGRFHILNKRGRPQRVSQPGFEPSKRRKQGNLQAGGRERPRVPAHQGQWPAVKNLALPATGGATPGDGVHEGRRRIVIPGGLALGLGALFLQLVGGRVVQGKSPSRMGVVRAMSRPDHWRGRSTPEPNPGWNVHDGCLREWSAVSQEPFGRRLQDCSAPGVDHVLPVGQRGSPASGELGPGRFRLLLRARLSAGVHLPQHSMSFSGEPRPMRVRLIVPIMVSHRTLPRRVARDPGPPLPAARRLSNPRCTSARPVSPRWL